MPDAALDVDDNMPPVEEVKPAEDIVTDTVESAPTEQAEVPVEPEDNKMSDRAQERFNKITADKYAEKRRADEAEKRLKDLQSSIPQKPAKIDEAPTLESFDYDESKFNEALIDYKVNQKAAEIRQQQDREVAAAEGERRQAAFNVGVAKFSETATDYQDVVRAIPALPDGVLNAITQSDKGPELAYYLGKHLDVADEIANASPMAAAMQLGAISARLGAVKPNIAPSAAPEPIEPISSGGSVSKDIGDMSMDEIYSL